MQDLPQSELVQIALDRTAGDEFENFAIQFLAAKFGANFVPIGGTRDGGADGLIATDLYEDSSRPDHFMQATREKDYRSKIRHTVRRLREVDRSPSQLLYFTTQVVSSLDVVEYDLGVELDITIRIRDGKYIAAQVTTDRAAAAAYYSHLHHRTQFLEGIGRGSVLSRSPHISEPHVYTFLVGELERETAGPSFANGVIDALIVYALEGTDPNENIMMSEEQIRDKIVETLPAARSLIADQLRPRLEAISRKPYRRINWHRSDDMWVLPYEEREKLQRASIEDEALRLTVRDELAARFEDSVSLDLGARDLAELTLETVQLAFEEDGLRFSRFLEGDRLEDSTPFVSDAVRSVLDRNRLTGENRLLVADAITDSLRNVFYSSTRSQRDLLQRMSRAYSIVFVLHGEPRVLRYFDDAFSHTTLYVGADILIKALSERYVQPADQHTRNLIKSAQSAGARLVLAAPVLEEVIGHLRGSDSWFFEYLDPVRAVHDYQVARYVPKILIRAFLYSQVLPSEFRPGSWQEFVSQFCNYVDLHQPQAGVQVQRYLQAEFGLYFEDWGHVMSVCDGQEHDALRDALMEVKESEFLARNDAYVFQLVSHCRSARGDVTRSSEYGYQTWWLSEGEGAAVRKMAQVARSTNRILMHPGFLAKFIQLAPTAAAARSALADFLPSLLGIKLARRITEKTFGELMDTVKEAESLEPGRRAAKIAGIMDELRGMRHSEFSEDFEDQGLGEMLLMGDP